MVCSRRSRNCRVGPPSRRERRPRTALARVSTSRNRSTSAVLPHLFRLDSRNRSQNRRTLAQPLFCVRLQAIPLPNGNFVRIVLRGDLSLARLPPGGCGLPGSFSGRLSRPLDARSRDGPVHPWQRRVARQKYGKASCCYCKRQHDEPDRLES